MLAGWSLRTRLVLVVTVALLPVLALSAWYAVREQRASQLRDAEAVTAAADLVVARHRELIEASRRLLVAMCEEDTVRLSANPDASAADINRCEAYLGQVLQKFPNEYSSAFVTDAAGTARCSSAPIAVGMGFSDREIFRLVRETRKFTVSAQLASRVTPNAVIPTALPILQGGEFRGMCAVGISLRSFADLVTPASTADRIAVSLVDRRGVSLAGSRRGGARPAGRRAARRGDRRRPAGIPRLRPGRPALRVPPAAARRDLDLRGRGGAGRRGVFPRCWPTGAGSSWSCWRSARRCWRSGSALIAGACSRCATSATSPIAWRAATT